jgi:hypothetical protein
MTIDKLKEDLKTANISISGIKKKSDFVDLYISNGLHNGASVTATITSVTATKAASVKAASPKAAKPKSTSSKATKAPSPKAPQKLSMAARMREFKKMREAASKAEIDAISGQIKEGEPKEELILSLMISAHGRESYEFIPHTPVAEYYKNNVRVYSRACVPGVPGLRDRRNVRKSIDDAFTIFSNNPGKATQEVMAEYTGVDRDHYRKFLDSLTECDITRDALKNKERCGGLITYLSQKLFVFEDENLTALNSRRPYYKTDFEWNQFLESRGVNVSDIRLKITASDGSVTYRNIFNPYEEMSQIYHSNKERKEPIDIITKFNLIYRHGIEFILKDVLHREKLIGPALEIFKFKEGENRISSLNLDQLYEFFKLVGIKYINIIDHSCRSFLSSLKVTEEKAEELYKEEQKYIVKPVAFGKRSDSKRTKGKRSRRQIGSKRRQMSHRSRKHGIK